MPGTFAGYETIAQTKNFLVTCESDPEARVRAGYVADTCEADLAMLNTLFSTNFEAGNTSKYGIWVIVLKDQQSSSSNGWNYGYETEESSRIVLQRAFIPPPPPPPQPGGPPLVPPPNYARAVPEFPRFVFVAELAEILMGFTGYGWGAGNSMGEGLSNLLGALLHPEGYYTTGQGPRINQWLNGTAGPPAIVPLYDWISKTENTDQDIYSYGCAILFINYLVYQLGYTLQQVIRAGGGTLAGIYASLTGQPASAARPAFTALLQRHIGISPNNSLPRDNIFPLYMPDHQGVTIEPGDVTTLIQSSGPQQTFVLKPGIICGAAPYIFTREQWFNQLPVFAWARGTANAQFRWTIGGQDANVRGQWAQLVLNTPVAVKNPDGHTDSLANNATIQYFVFDAWNASAIYIATVTEVGNYSLDVSARIREQAIATDPEVSGTYTVDAQTITWEPGDDFRQAQKHCNPHLVDLSDSIWILVALLNYLKNAPDPAPESRLQEVVRAAGQVQKAVVQYAAAAHATPAQIWGQFGKGAGLRSAFTPANRIDRAQFTPPAPPQKQNID
jgi:hypothetical protein